MNDERLRSTVDEILRLHRKIRQLEARRAQALDAAAFQALTASRAAVADATSALTSESVPGRAAVTRQAYRAQILQPGEIVRIERGQMRPKLSPGAAAVYILFADDGAVLYVGKSVDPAGRIAASHLGKRWAWVEIACVESEAAALDLEGDLIFQYQPPLNVADRKRRRRPS